MLFGRLPANCRLGSCRLGPAMSLDLPWIAIPRQRREFLSCRGTEQPLERSYPLLGQPCPGDKSDSPHQLDWQVVKELQLGVGIDNHEPVGLGHLRSDFCQMLGSRYTD